ncbi:trypsin-like serine peptidase [Streptomyces sp. NPDC090022]|uniref:trypsin-like serine peptidase n=1 Tax=Streptomyces sp. NPDC090022 TaxID=3365920 RepID=UPI00381A31B3
MSRVVSLRRALVVAVAAGAALTGGQLPARAAATAVPSAPPAAVPSAPPGAVPSAVPSAPAAMPSAPAAAPGMAALLPASARYTSAVAGPGEGWDFAGIPVVGRMYSAKTKRYFCTASVVSSPGRDLVLTAAHCLLGADARQLAFVPQNTAAKPQPHGKFPVRRIWIDPRYRKQGVNRAAALDVAFVEVGPRADGRRVEDVVGGNRLVTGSGFAHRAVRLIGHPARSGRPRACDNRTTRFTSTDPKIPGSFLRIDCTGFLGGTSGGPFLARYDARTRTGDVVGVIGGWKTGGDLADTSYSSSFGADVRKLYARAASAAR